MNNAISHARADSIWIDLLEDEGYVVLSVKDDGQGFDPYIRKERHYGIPIMDERAALLGGTLSVTSAPGKGCTVVLATPVRRDSD